MRSIRWPRRFLAALAVCCLAFLMGARAAAQAVPGTVLSMPVSVRAMGMGEAYAAAEDDAFAAHYNPASPLASRQVSAIYQKSNAFLENYGALAYGSPLPFGHAAGGLVYYDGGRVDLTDDRGNERSVSGQRDMLGTVTLGLSPEPRLSVAGTVKVLHSRLVEEFTGTAYLVDAGAHYKPYSWLSVGLAAQNFGTKLNYAGEGETIPKVFRGGAAVTRRHFAHRGRLAFDVLGASNDSTLKQHVGFEYTFAGAVAARVGYKIGYEDHGASFGFGITQESVTVDLAFLPFERRESVGRLSVTLKL